MRVHMLVVWAIVLGTGGIASAKHEATVWNAEADLPDGGHAKVVFLGQAPPDQLLPANRCAAGTWKLARHGETATHFIGTLDAPSFNFAHAATKRLSIKVRKTRELMGVHRSYRAALHAILRASGQLVIREVRGGQWEVIGYAPDSMGAFFANNPRWNVDAKHPPKPAEAQPVIDQTADASALAKLINDYRATKKLPRVPISAAMTKVARAHVHDLAINQPVTDACNLHSWSSHGSWSSCCYDGGKAAARCMWAKPKEIAHYSGNGYEIAATAAGITPDYALELWQHSPKHHEIVINGGIWTKPWRAMGVAIEGDYAVAWFGEEADTK